MQQSRTILPIRSLRFQSPLRFLRGGGPRLALTVLALAWGVASVCGNALVGRVTFDAFQHTIDATVGRADLRVSAMGDASFPKDVAIAVSRVPGVAYVVPVVSATAFVADGSGEAVVVHGMDLVDRRAAAAYGVTSRTGWLRDLRVFAARSILVPRPFAERHRLEVGGRLVLDTPTGRAPFVVVGVIEPEGLMRAYDDAVVLMDLRAAQQALTGSGKISRIDVVTQDGADAGAVAGALRTVVPTGLQVQTAADVREQADAALRAVRLILSAVGLFSLGIGFLIAFNGLSSAFERRAWQIGLIAALGARPTAIRSRLVKEALLLGIAGVLLGIPAGIGLGRVLLPYIIGATSLVARAALPPSEFAVDPASLVLAAAMGMAVAFLAALLPAHRAAHVGVVSTIQGRGREQAAAHAGVFGWVRVSVGAGIVVAVVLQLVWRSTVWGLTATSLIAVGTALAAQPLVLLAAWPFDTLLRRAAGPTGGFAAAHVARGPRRSALTVATIGVGLGSVLWLWTVAGSFERSLIDVLTQVNGEDLVVSSAHAGAGYMEATIDDALLARLRSLPGVTGVIAGRNVELPYRNDTVALDLFDPSYFETTSFGRWPLTGPHAPDVWSSVAAGHAVVASSNFLLHHGGAVGDDVTLDTPSGPVALRIAGVTTHFASPRGTLVLSREVYAARWGDRRITRASVKVDEQRDVDEIRASIMRTFGRSYAIRVRSSAELVDYFASQVRAAFAGVYVLAGSVLLVVLVGLGDTLAAAAADRTREIGILRAHGVRRRHVRRMLFLEAFEIGVLGVVLALVAGVVQGALWVKATFPSLLGWAFDLDVPWSRAGLLGALCLVVCFLAALAPGIASARIDPATALRYE